ncbi:hypothetical protein NKH77_55975 [Streptomyces sp. M19]
MSLPEEWWALLSRAQHVLVTGPVETPEALGPWKPPATRASSWQSSRA